MSTATTAGWKTSEGQLAFLKVAVTSVVAIFTLLGYHIPSWLQPDAGWVTAAALLSGAIVTSVYGSGRVSLKKTLAAVEKVAPQAVTDVGLHAGV